MFADWLTDRFNDETMGRIIVGIAVFFGTTVVSFIVGRWWGKRRAWKEWEHRQFLGRIIVSINMLADGWLKIRTVFERSLEEVFLNPVAIDKIRAASKRTSLQDPLLPLDKEDRWFLLNFVLNAVTELFSETTVRHDATGTLKPVNYLIFLTCEVLGEDRIRKVRAMLVRREYLEEFPYADTMPKLERDWHEDRVLTLRRAAVKFREEPDLFMPLEIYA